MKRYLVATLLLSVVSTQARIKYHEVLERAYQNMEKKRADLVEKLRVPTIEEHARAQYDQNGEKTNGIFLVLSDPALIPGTTIVKEPAAEALGAHYVSLTQANRVFKIKEQVPFAELGVIYTRFEKEELVEKVKNVYQVVTGVAKVYTRKEFDPEKVGILRFEQSMKAKRVKK